MKTSTLERLQNMLMHDYGLKRDALATNVRLESLGLDCWGW